MGQPPRPALDQVLSTTGSRLPSLTGMRFIAAIMVFFFHANYEYMFGNPGAQSVYGRIFGQGGWSGVGFFFILSGFVLTWSWRPSDRARSFWRRRALKIYPNHITTFVVAAILQTVLLAKAFSGGNALLHIFLLQAWTPTSDPTAFNDVSWSLSCEALFYLMFPLLIMLIRKIRPERLWLWAGIVIGLVALMPLIALALPHQPFLPFANASASQMWFIYIFPPVRLLDFVFGILLARIVQTGRRLPLSMGGAAVLAVVSYAVAPLFPLTYPLTAVTLVPLGLLIAATAVADVNGRRTPLSTRVAVWLGEISFAVYMWHKLVITYGHRLLGGGHWSTPTTLGVLALFLAVTLVLSWLQFTLVERPIMRRWSRPRVRPQTPSEPVAVNS